MKYKHFFVQVLKNHYPNHVESLIVEIDTAYEILSKDTKFAFTSKNPMDKRLDFSTYFLALIKILERKAEDYKQIRKICLEVASEYTKPTNRFQEWLKKLPVKLISMKFFKIFLKALDKKISTKGHEDGFVAKVITDKAETYGLGYGVDILECGICKLFAKHNAQKYVSILCEVDELTSSLAGLELVRTGVLACGADKCDMRFKKK